MLHLELTVVKTMLHIIDFAFVTSVKYNLRSQSKIHAPHWLKLIT